LVVTVSQSDTTCSRKEVEQENQRSFEGLAFKDTQDFTYSLSCCLPDDSAILPETDDVEAKE
jgi:hypothetical protein